MTDEYAVMVSALAKSGADIRRELTDEEAHWVHMIMGIAGEAGELLDAVKKAAIYRKPLDMDHVIEELGDLEFYMEGLRQGMHIRREEVLAKNQEKLAIRYKGLQYSDSAARDRADKQE